MAYRVVIAWMNTSYEPPRPAAAVWKNGVSEKKLLDVKNLAAHYAAREHSVYESALVLSFPMKEKDPLGKARARVLDVARHLGLAGEKHESGRNPRVSAPLKKRIDRVLGRGKK